MKARHYAWIGAALSLLLVTFAAPVWAQDYGTGAAVNVPYVEPGTLSLDGQADETAWENAVVVDPAANWDGGWSGHPTADVATEARLLYTTDTLFVSFTFEDYTDLFWDQGAGEQILLGIDLVHQAGVTDTLVDQSWGGFVENAPNKGPVAYKIWVGNDSIPSVSLNWSDEISPVDSGWVAGSVWVDEESFRWGAELAIVGSSITQGSQIGFNIGGASAKEEGRSDRGEGTYAFFSWQSKDYAGGDVMHQSASYGTLSLAAPVAIEVAPVDEIPVAFTLGQNYPNPFNPTTNIEYGLERAGNVRIAVYNTLGQQVGLLVDRQQSAGTYRVRWDAVNLPSGVYLYQLQVDGALVAARKMLLLK